MSRILSIFALSAITVLCACSHTSEDNSADAHGLFSDQKHLLKTYIDSLKHLPDTIDATDMINRFQDALYHINMKYPPETDLLLSEGQNEVLFKMTRNLVTLAKRHKVEVDSFIDLKTDTVIRIEYNPDERPAPKTQQNKTQPKTAPKPTQNAPVTAEPSPAPAPEPTPAPAAAPTTPTAPPAE